jgi:L-malate glycosyltransferase
VVDGQCGLVVPKKNPIALAAALLKLYNERYLCQKFGAAAREHIAANFNIRDTILKTKKLYEELAGQ